MEDENWRSAASGQSSAHTPTMKPRLLGESCEFVLLISVKNNPQTSALVPLSSKQIRTTQSDTLRPSGRTWPLTPTPPMAQKKHTRTGWDMRRRWTTPTAPPTNSRQYLLVRHGQAGAWPAPTCGGFRLGGGSPTGEHERLQSGKRGKKKKSIQSNNTAGWNISANVRFVLRSKHDAYVPPSISADHQVKYVHLTLTHVCLRSCICKGLKPNQLCSHFHESPPAAACYGGWQKTPGVIMAVTWPVRPVLKIRSQFIGSRGYRWSTDRLVKQPAHLYTHVTQTRVLDSWKHRTEKPGWTSSVRLWKSSSHNKRTGSGGSKQTSRWKTFWRSFSRHF